MNIFSSPLVALFNNISVGWHVLGVAVIVAILILVPDKHQSVDFVFTQRINNRASTAAPAAASSSGSTCCRSGSCSRCTRRLATTRRLISEETGGRRGAAKGVWRSVFWSGVIGWIVLLAITFAATDVKSINDAKNGFGAGFSPAIFDSALTSSGAKAVLLIAVVGQLFCGMAALTSASRMCYVFSRDGVVHGHRLGPGSTTIECRCTRCRSWCSCAAVTLPALKGDEHAHRRLLAGVSIAVIGLDIAHVNPVLPRWRKGDAGSRGPGRSGAVQVGQPGGGDLGGDRVVV